MRKQRTISRKAWQRATNALLWYPDNVKEYGELLEELTTGDPEKKEETGKPVHSDPTASAAIRLAANRRAAMLQQEIEAVELAVFSLLPEQQAIIRRRFWSYRTAGSRRKPKQYDYLQDQGYSLEGMRRIVRGVVVQVAGYLGEK